MLRLLPALIILESLAAAQFDAHVVAADFKAAYQVVAADLNRDGKLDLIAVDSGGTDLVWFENPTWARHVIASGLHSMINVAAKDIDGDGIPEIALAYEFSSTPRNSAGIVAILHSNGDPRRPWTLREIDRLPTSHRLRWAHVGGRTILLNAPLAAASAEPPLYSGNVPLVYYEPGEWRRQLISTANRGVQHGIYVSPHPGGDHVLTASFSGIDHFQLIAGRWAHRSVNPGDPSPCPKCGSSDVAVGHATGVETIAAIEPWHGNQVVTYTEQAHRWIRRVIDSTLDDGHTLLFARFGNDARESIVAGYRGNGGGVRLYQPAGRNWTQTDIETGSPAASCTTAELGPGPSTDLICTGGSKLVIYSPRR